MATYIELVELSTDVTLLQRVRVACYIAAHNIRSEAESTPFHAERLAWAKKVFERMNAEDLNRLIWSVLVANAAVPKASILAASDSAVQTAVDGAVNLFAVG